MFRFSDLVSRVAEKEKLADKRKREQAEVSTLKTQLTDISESHKVEMEHAASERTRLEEEVSSFGRRPKHLRKKLGWPRRLPNGSRLGSMPGLWSSRRCRTICMVRLISEIPSF